MVPNVYTLDMRCAMYKVGLAKYFLEKVFSQMFFWDLTFRVKH